MTIPKKTELGSASFYGTEPTLDEAIERYKIHPASSDFYQKTKAVFLKKIRERAQDNDCILDVGCSFGFVTCEIARIYLNKGLNAKIIGVDIDERQIRNAVVLAKSKKLEIQFSVCDARRIEGIFRKPDLRITRIVSLYSFHHIPDFPGRAKNKYRRDFLSKIFLFSQFGAVLIIGDIAIPRDFKKINQWTEPRLAAAQKASGEAGQMEENAIKGVIGRINEYPVSAKELEKLIQKAGWKIAAKELIVPCNDIVIVAQKPKESQKDLRDISV